MTRYNSISSSSSSSGAIISCDNEISTSFPSISKCINYLALVIICYQIIATIHWRNRSEIPVCQVAKTDENKLTLQWTPTYCYSNDCDDKSSEDWKIIGLWPNRSNGSKNPEYCCSKSWNNSEIQLLLENNLPQLFVSI